MLANVMELPKGIVGHAVYYTLLFKQIIGLEQMCRFCNQLSSGASSQLGEAWCYTSTNGSALHTLFTIVNPETLTDVSENDCKELYHITEMQSIKNLYKEMIEIIKFLVFLYWLV